MNNFLFTGASGFLGANALPILNGKYDVDTLGFGETDKYKIDISKEIPALDKKYDIVLHAAGKAHIVPKTEAERKSFFDINVQGTKNLCSALEKSGLPKSFIFISTVAVYGCETGELITEDHPLEGVTPYAKSKIEAEKFLTNWCEKNNITLTILRPSLLAGKNPPGNLGAMIKGIKTGRYASICGGKSKKSVAMAEDIANVIPYVADKGGIYNICDSENPSFYDLELLISSQLGKRKPLNIPYWFVLPFALIGNLLGRNFPINTLRLKKITESLTFSNEKLIASTGFTPMNVISNFKIN